MTDVTVELQSVNDYRFSAEYGIAESLEVGEVTFLQPLLRVADSDRIFGGALANGERISGVLGYREIKHLGAQLSFVVTENRVDHIIVSPEAPETDVHSNMYQVLDKIVAELVIDGSSYACAFDTGAPQTHIAESIFNKHKRALGLKRLKRRAAKRRGLSNFRRDFEFIDSLPITLGGLSFSLENAQYNKKSISPGGCLIGLDTIIQAGGATIDLNNLNLKLGPSADTALN